MPALHLFSRRTILAGDDLQLPSLAWGLLNCLQLFVLLPILLYSPLLHILSDDGDGNDTKDAPMLDKDSYSFNSSLHTDLNESVFVTSRNLQTDDCTTKSPCNTRPNYQYLILLSHLIATSIYFAISLHIERCIFHTSSIGTPTMNIEARMKPLSSLIEFKLTYWNGCNLLLLGVAVTLTILDFVNNNQQQEDGDYDGGYIIESCDTFPMYWYIAWFLLLSTQTFQAIFAMTSLISIWRIQPINSLNQQSTNEEYHHSYEVDNVHHRAMMHEAEELWRTRCEGCCRILAVSTCFLFGGRGIVSTSSNNNSKFNLYGDISRALADYFADFGVLDVVPSDVGLGIVVLRHMQAQRRLVAKREALHQLGYGSSRPGSRLNLTRVENDSDAVNNGAGLNRRTLFFRWRNTATVEDTPSSPLRQSTSPNNNNRASPSRANEEYQSFSRVVLSPLNSQDASALIEGAHFARHQLAIYTWILYYYEYPITGSLRLIGRALRQQMNCADATAYSPNRQERIVGDNFLHIHEATMLAHAGLQKADIAYATFEAGFYETPYCIIIDRQWKTVVLSIRGSLTLEDCVVDVLLDPCPLDSSGEQFGFDGAGQYCHGGVFGCTRWLYDDLERHKILDTLLLGEYAKYRDYTLRIVGHSLGAGIGVILSLMLRNKFPSLRCLCYSPPGGLLTWELATSCSHFVNSFVLDSDIVPRLSLNNMESLRDEVLNLIARVKLSKYDISKRIFWQGLCGEVELGDLDYLIQQNEDLLYPAESTPDSDFLQQLRRFEAMQQNRRTTRGISREISLYPPGNIIHLVKTGQSRSCTHNLSNCITCGASNSGAEYTPVRKENDDFNEIEISPTLWTDHFPNRVCNALEKVAEKFDTGMTFETVSNSNEVV